MSTLVDDTGRLRLLLMTNSIAIGGMEEHVRLLAAWLDRDHFHVTVAIPDDPALASFESEIRTVADTTVLATPDRRYGIGRWLRESWRFYRFLRRHKVQVIHLHSTTYHGQTGAVLISRLAGVRRVFLTEHLAPYDPISRRERWMRHHIMTFLTGLVCVSEKNQLARAAQIRTTSAKTIVVNNGIDVARFDHVDAASVAEVRSEFDLDGHVVVGSIVRLEPGKGVHDLVDAFGLLAPQHPSARLMIVGDGALHDDLVAQVHDLGLADSVVFAGFHADPRPFLAAIDVFVLPVPVGSASIALLEAMAMGCPAVITFAGAGGEAVVPGVSGWWAEPNNPTSLADRIGALLDDADARSAMGDAARRRVEADFTAERVAQQLGALYRGSGPVAKG